MSTIVVVRHDVVDYARWRAGFNEHVKEAPKHGFTALTVLRDKTNPNTVTVMLQAQDLKAAKAFLASNNLRKMMKKEGVIGKPEISYLSDVTRS
jgi:uncharacterized protein YeaO (DUF488 family)